jgi:nucleotide-binding universal stress UspA family protein
MTKRQIPVSGAIRSIVVGTDGSATATEAVRRAADLARAEGATLHVVTAYDPTLSGSVRREMGEMPAELHWMASPGEAADVILRQAASLVVREGIDVEVHSAPGDAAEALVAVADEVGADLIVVGNKGMAGLAGFIRRSVPNRVSHRATCDVLIVNTTQSAA